MQMSTDSTWWDSAIEFDSFDSEKEWIDAEDDFTEDGRWGPIDTGMLWKIEAGVQIHSEVGKLVEAEFLMDGTICIISHNDHKPFWILDIKSGIFREVSESELGECRTFTRKLTQTLGKYSQNTIVTFNGKYNLYDITLGVLRHIPLSASNHISTSEGESDIKTISDSPSDIVLISSYDVSKLIVYKPAKRLPMDGNIDPVFADIFKTEVVDCQQVGSGNQKMYAVCQHIELHGLKIVDHPKFDLTGKHLVVLCERADSSHCLIFLKNSASEEAPIRPVYEAYVPFDFRKDIVFKKERFDFIEWVSSKLPRSSELLLILLRVAIKLQFNENIQQIIRNMRTFWYSQSSIGLLKLFGVKRPFNLKKDYISCIYNHCQDLSAIQTVFFEGVWIDIDRIEGISDPSTNGGWVRRRFSQSFEYNYRTTDKMYDLDDNTRNKLMNKIRDKKFEKLGDAYAVLSNKHIKHINYITSVMESGNSVYHDSLQLPNRRRGCFLNCGQVDDCNKRWNNGITPLMLSSISGNAENTRRLIIEGASINAVDDKGYSSLTLAIIRGNMKIVNLLYRLKFLNIRQLDIIVSRDMKLLFETVADTEVSIDKINRSNIFNLIRYHIVRHLSLIRWHGKSLPMHVSNLIADFVGDYERIFLLFSK
jgi:hypothetical protein